MALFGGRIILSSTLFNHYLKCHLKCWLSSKNEPIQENRYASWLEGEEDRYKALQAENILLHSNAALEDWQLNKTIYTDLYSTTVFALNREILSGHPRRDRRTIYGLSHREKVTRDDHLMLVFDAIAFSDSEMVKIDEFYIIHGCKSTKKKIKALQLIPDARRKIREIGILLSHDKPPELVIKHHCSECFYKKRCLNDAIVRNSLSLLASIKESECKTYYKRGIFTITQLSYTFKPRSLKKRTGLIGEKHSHPLKALAIREKKIHLAGDINFEIEGTPIFIDVEGLPRSDFYYLIGLRVIAPKGVLKISLWADNEKDEGRIWAEFLSILSNIEKPTLIHYGSYEIKFFDRLIKRYGCDENPSEDLLRVLRNSINLLNIVYSHIYFPTYSNGLKEVAGYLGFTWSENDASGLEAIMWRSEWEINKNPDLKQRLLKYNTEDCQAAEHVATAVSNLIQTQKTGFNTVTEMALRAENIHTKPNWKFQKNTFEIPAFEQINKAAYWDYQQSLIVTRNKIKNKKPVKKNALKKEGGNFKPNIERTLYLDKPANCQVCSGALYIHGYKNRIIYDLKRSPRNIKRWVVCYKTVRYRCPSCSIVTDTASILQSGKYGPVLKAFAIYLNIELRLSGKLASDFLGESFGIQLPTTSIAKFRREQAIKHENTYQQILRNIISGQVIHADETKINIQGTNHYVWVLTDASNVAYLYSKTREADFIHAYLKDFKGVLVSDFYAAYDGLECAQQKCLIHLIRDLNEDLKNEPYNPELKMICMSFSETVKPIIETIDRFGLKKYHLKKHKKPTTDYLNLIHTANFKSDSAIKWQNRFTRISGKIFTFLDYDQVPWNNNNAEHAIKHIALLRNVVGGSSTSTGIRHYLVLLSIFATCKNKSIKFLDFLLSDFHDPNAILNPIIK